MPKRTSESVSNADDGNPPKKVDTAATGEKRKRGRPRKYPEGSRPQPPPGPKRGRGRPRKDANATDTPAKPKTPKGDGKRGRPRKSLPANGTDAAPEKPEQSESTSAEAAKADEEDADADGDDEEITRSYWLMKAEPESRMEKGVDVKFSIDDLRERTEPEAWDGVRNPLARNNMRDMKKGDHAFFYHSNCKVPGIAGMMEIVQESSPDETAFDPAHPYYDEKSSRADPKWVAVHVEFRHKFPNFVSLNDLKAHSESGGVLENLQVLKQSRLSVCRISKKEWEFIIGLANESK
ncbi:hypothetical protein FE257_008383 [Aspergillus nanangensis]|uniref:Thymocyte nuclear protein 1 n=1 Tax=Aspergillus nanangensis TaxID=2582783 RepID=A0AAD4GTL0_ASPNN|nr:hypothetical protein FE257_008383 [Aspergillus nanangensis]